MNPRDGAGFVEEFMSWLYNTRAGRRLRPLLLESKRLHRLVEWYAETSLSRAHIAYAVRKYGIDLAEVAIPAQGFASFNGFFTRELKPGARPFDLDPDVLVSPADARLFVLPSVPRDVSFQVKGVAFSIPELLANHAEAEIFDRGSVAIFRLYAEDCHRLYFPCAGVPRAPRQITGHFYAVTPFPGNDVSHFAINQRTVTRFDSERLGPMAFVDIGGFCISSIVATFEPDQPVAKGDPKSYFRYGGSTLVVVATRGSVRYDPHLIAVSARGEETRVKIGQRVAVKA
jgi:phosphatidylserine decarboxylase